MMKTGIVNYWKPLVLGGTLFLAGMIVGLRVTSVAAAPMSGDMKLNHVGISVDNMAQAVDFYSRTMGFREAFRLFGEDGRLRGVYVQVSRETFLELQPSTKDRPAGLTHIGLEVEHLSLSIARLKDLNAAVEEPRIGQSKAPLTNAFGPDGVRFELLELGPESLQRKA